MKGIMRITSSIVALALLLLTARANAQLAPLSPKATLDEVLEGLHLRGMNLQDFTADVTLTETDPILGREKAQIGKVFYQRKPNSDSRIRVSFELFKASGNAIKQHQEYLLDNGSLVDQNYQTKLQVTRQVLKPGQKLDPLKLGEGPFPLPIGQPPKEVLQTFDAKLIPSSRDDPADTAHIQLIPKPGTRFETKFSIVDVWVSRADSFTPRIATVEKKGTGTLHTTDLSNVKMNAGIADAAFKLPEPGKDWGVETKELGE